ncbi:MAG: hypothetical protein NTW16_16110 [Bacteroidetes bacterium]|nr:hypothetical protein [Bacteroidota bacterium]
MRPVLFFLSLFLVLGSSAQPVSKAEYFFDSDPGYGHGSDIPISPGKVVDMTFNASTAGLSAGIHTLFIRVKSGRWSQVLARHVGISPGTGITGAEYFFDTDPGFGNGISIPVTAGNTVDLDFTANTAGLSPGVHQMFVRVKSGKWSQCHTGMIGVSLNDGITRAEYFFNADPGFGQGTPISITPGKLVDLDFNANRAGLPAGIHTLCVRVKSGNWSQCHARQVYVSPVAGITRAEYFFDTDPGFGLGTPMVVSPGKLVELNVNAGTAGLSPGIHTLFIRVKSGKWSQAYSRLVGVSPDAGITKAEYFMSADPGFGNGVPIDVVPGKLVTLDFNIANINLVNGMSRIYIRTFSGKWSQTYIHDYCQNPVPDFSTDVAQLGNPTTFTNLTQQTDTNSQFFWDVNGDGSWEHTGGGNFMYLYSAPGSYQARLQVVSPGGCTEFIIKEVLVYACMVPTSLTAGNITFQSAELSWTPGTFGSQWELLYGLQGFNPTTGGILIQGINSKPYTLSGLSPSTTYDFYVRTVCSSELSVWSAPKTFTTSENVCTPGWTISPNYQYNMQVVGKLMTGGVQSYNPNDQVGAFVNGECRGMASPDPARFGLVFLSIGSNVASGEMVQLVVWKVAECSECPTGLTMMFQNQLQTGSPGNPYPVACGQAEVPLAFGEGYTWFSVNVNPGEMGLNSLFSDLNPCEADRILGQNAFAVVYNGDWIGSLNTVNPAQMYKMQLCSQQNITIPGQPVYNSPISLGAGYTWLGYQPQDGLPINTALSGITPPPVENNRVLGQNSFAVYYQGQWIGSLTSMNPGKGYIIEVSNPCTLQFPATSGKKEMLSEEIVVSPTDDIPLANQQFSMMLIARLKLPDGIISCNPGDVVFAYSGSECRGMAVPVTRNNGTIFMSVGSDIQTGEKIRFKAWLSRYGMLADINETVVFRSLDKAGTMDEPLVLTLNGFKGMENHAGDEIFIGEPFPNPFVEETAVPFKLSGTALVKLALYDGMGRKLKIIDFGYHDAGLHKIYISRSNLPAGVYFYRMEVLNPGIAAQKYGKFVICR